MEGTFISTWQKQATKLTENNSVQELPQRASNKTVSQAGT